MNDNRAAVARTAHPGNLIGVDNCPLTRSDRWSGQCETASIGRVTRYSYKAPISQSWKIHLDVLFE
jgi:hypothetical protein